MNRRLFLSSAAASAAAYAHDWPQWRGPNRDGLSTETGLLKTWPASGPKPLWSISTLSEGYGTVAVIGDRIYVQGRRGNESVLFVLNLSNGSTIWTIPLGRRLDQDRGGGPRGTPTVDGDRVYAMTEDGELVCHSTKTGNPIWRKNILAEFKGSNPNWNISESPLVDGDRLYVTPGGPGAGVVALDKMTGKLIWACKELSDTAGYSSCIAADIGGVRTIMTLTSAAGVGIRAADGKLMWRESSPANNVANCTTPIFSNNKVFYTSNYGTGCTLMELAPASGNMVTAKKVYSNKDMQNHHGGVVLVKDHLYGFSNAILTCMEFSTGAVKWKERSVGKGSLTYADGSLYLLSEAYVCGLAEATPEGYREKGRFRIEDSGLPSWAYPVVSGGRLFIRNQGVLTCYNIKAA